MKGGGRGGGHSRASGGERSRSQTQHRRRQLCTFCQPSIRSRRGPCRNRIGIGIESSRYHHTKPKGLHHQPDDVSDPRSRCLRDVCQGEREGGKGRKRIFAILRISLPFFARLLRIREKDALFSLRLSVFSSLLPRCAF